MKASTFIDRLRKLGNEKDRQGMARYGINVSKAFGVSVYKIRELAKGIPKDHGLAADLWDSGFHEARIMAIFVEEKDKVAEKQMESWVKDFDSWDLCDLCCAHLFDRTPYAYEKAFEWTEREQEFVKRAGYVLMAALAVHDKKADDKAFEQFFPIIVKGARDERNFVKKAVNWALRQIGKRNKALNNKAIRLAEKIKKIDSKAARWVATDALRELTSEKCRLRLKG